MTYWDNYFFVHHLIAWAQSSNTFYFPFYFLQPRKVDVFFFRDWDCKPLSSGETTQKRYFQPGSQLARQPRWLPGCENTSCLGPRFKKFDGEWFTIFLSGRSWKSLFPYRSSKPSWRRSWRRCRTTQKDRPRWRSVLPHPAGKTKWSECLHSDVDRGHWSICWSYNQILLYMLLVWTSLVCLLLGRNVIIKLCAL